MQRYSPTVCKTTTFRTLVTSTVSIREHIIYYNDGNFINMYTVSLTTWEIKGLSRGSRLVVFQCSANKIYCCTVVELYGNLYTNFSVQKQATLKFCKFNHGDLHFC